MSNSRNDIAWEKIFEKYSILDNIQKCESFRISSGKINEFREARLMTKFDHTSQLPSLFSTNNLSILPITRGDYIIGNFKTFLKFENNNTVATEQVLFPEFLESLDPSNITSESASINCAFVSKIFHKFLEDDTLQPTVSGRMSSQEFSFTIDMTIDKTFKINVENSQLEIDGGYEGANTLSIIEAKNYLAEDFLIRQLYYPFRLWAGKISKPIQPIFLTYSNGIFHLRKYEFGNPTHYNSIQLISEKKYAIRHTTINIEAIQNIQSNILIVSEPEIPFPQANSFERLINLCELLKQKSSLSHENITENYDFAGRQTNYYTDAGRYLGIINKKIENNKIMFSLSASGENIFRMHLTERQSEFIKLILSHSIFNNCLSRFFEKGDTLSKDEVSEIMKKEKVYNIGAESTFKRRASTILSWVNWIIKQIEE
jgi:hypothetical protein